MPLYEFICENCGEHVEELVKMNTKYIKCPTCGKRMQKQMSVSNFHLVGHCWYKDGYSSQGNNKKGGTKKNA